MKNPLVVLVAAPSALTLGIVLLILGRNDSSKTYFSVAGGVLIFVGSVATGVLIGLSRKGRS